METKRIKSSCGFEIWFQRFKNTRYKTRFKTVSERCFFSCDNSVRVADLSITVTFLSYLKKLTRSRRNFPFPRKPELKRSRQQKWAPTGKNTQRLGMKRPARHVFGRPLYTRKTTDILRTTQRVANLHSCIFSFNAFTLTSQQMSQLSVDKISPQTSLSRNG